MISFMGVMKGMIPVTYVCSNHISHGCKKGMIPVKYVFSNDISHGCKEGHDSSNMFATIISLMSIKRA